MCLLILRTQILVCFLITDMRLPQSWVVIFSLLVVGPWWSVSGQHNFDHEQALKRKANIYRRARQVKGRQKHVDRELGVVSTVDQVK